MVDFGAASFSRSRDSSADQADAWLNKNINGKIRFLIFQTTFVDVFILYKGLKNAFQQRFKN
jgi:hypothetical protein